MATARDPTKRQTPELTAALLAARAKMTPQERQAAGLADPFNAKARPIGLQEQLDTLLGNTPLPAPVDFAALDKDALGAANRQRKRAARNSLLLEGQPADAAAMSPPATLTRRRLGGTLAY